MLNQNKLKKYLDAGFNVLLEGSHGLGKTAVIKEVFESKGLKWKYFSASTMDPWIDFIGVPRTVHKDGRDVLDLIKPQEFADDTIEAIFFDEFNRAPPKVINAVMELIQFKSINGKKFNNLKVVWAAINPYDEEGTYSVEQLDPATKDRFHIQIQIPLELDTSYLIKTHGQLANPFIKWWNELPKELKSQISPRRLDYAIQVYSADGDLRDVLSRESNVKKLEDYIREMTKGQELQHLLQKSDKELKEFFTLENTIRYGEKILKEPKLSHFSQYFHKDFIEANIQKNDASKFNQLLIQYALKNESFYKKLSKESQTIVSKVKRNGGIIKNAHIDYALEQAITQVVRKNVNRSVPLFIRELENVFNTYCMSLKSHKSTDLVSFFDMVFNMNHENGMSLQNDIFTTILNFKTISTYKPATDSQKLFLGMFLNFANKYAKNDKSISGQFGQLLGKFYDIYVKNRMKKSTIENCGLIIAGFEETNWLVFKELLERKPDWMSLVNTVKFKDIMKVMKSRHYNTLKYKSPNSIEDAKEIFSKQNIHLTLSNISLKELIYEE